MANHNLDTTFRVAVEKLTQKSPAEAALNSGAEYDAEKGIFKIKYINQEYEVVYPAGNVKLVDNDEEEVPLTVQILILHYLATANGAPLQDKLISFKELPDGAIYIEPFTRRAIKPMLKLFDQNLPGFLELATAIGGRKAGLGDVSVTIDVFPRVPITYVIWAGDDEFESSGNILFDASARHYLPTEDYALVSSLVIYQLGGMVKKS